jgi:signal transduction histidine kinase
VYLTAFNDLDPNGRRYLQGSELGIYVGPGPVSTSALRSDLGPVRTRFLPDAALVISFTILGAALLSRNPKNRAGLLCLVVVLVPIVDVVRLYADSHGSPVVVRWAARLHLLNEIPLWLLTLVLPIILLDGRAHDRGWRGFAWIVSLYVIIGAVAVQLAGFWSDPPQDSLDEWMRPPGNFVVLIAGFTVWAVLHRVVISPAPQRMQAMWVLAGTVVFAFGGSLIMVIWPGLVEGGPRSHVPGLALPVRNALEVATALALPVACGVAISRARVTDALAWYHRLLVLTLLGVMVTGLYLALNVRVTSRVEVGGRFLDVVLVAEPLRMTVTAIMVALFSPLLYRWLQGSVGRLIYGRRGSPAEMMASLARQLAGASGPNDVMAAVADAVTRAVPDASVKVVLAAGDRDVLTLSRGHPNADPHDDVELVFQGVDVGRIELTPGPGGLSPADRELLGDVAVNAAAAVAAARRSAELQLAREQLVTTREQERRRIARDLHDGIGPILSALGFTLDALRVLTRDSEDAVHVAAQGRTQVREATNLVRSVANQLRPTGVDQLGLIGALKELTAWHTGPQLQVTLTTGQLPDLSAAVEVAVHAITAEALTNVARHARAHTCQITMTHDDSNLVVTIEDDGIGIEGTATGLGRTSMTERAEELGGQCTVATRSEGGTRVRAMFPIHPPPGETKPGGPSTSGGTP